MSWGRLTRCLHLFLPCTRSMDWPGYVLVLSSCCMHVADIGLQGCALLVLVTENRHHLKNSLPTRVFWAVGRRLQLLSWHSRSHVACRMVGAGEEHTNSLDGLCSCTCLIQPCYSSWLLCRIIAQCSMLCRNHTAAVDQMASFCSCLYKCSSGALADRLAYVTGAHGGYSAS